MKITYLSAAIIVVALAFSCQTSDEALTNEPKLQNESSSENPSLNKDEHGEIVLSFASEEEMNAQIHNLKQMAVNEGTDGWYAQFNGFTSQNQYMWIVAEEMDNASSIEEVYEIQKSHKGLLVFNDNKADEDISPYIPTTHLGSNLVCNKYGNVMIGGRIRNFNDVRSYSELQAAKSEGVTRAHNVTLIGGTGRIEYKKRRFWVEAWLNTDTQWVELKMTAHAKGLGWNIYRTTYSLKFDEEVQGFPYRTDFYEFIAKSGYNHYSETAELPAEIFLTLVRGGGSFSMTAFTRGVPIPTSFDVSL